MDVEYLNKRRLGMTLLPWKQKFCDKCILCWTIHMQNFNQIWLVSDEKKSFKFSQNWICNEINHMTSQILLDTQVFCPTNYADLAIFKPEPRKDIEKR